MQYETGDRVVHPAYGGGEIRAIQEKSFLNHTNRYYEIFVSTKNMTIMVPVKRANEIGIRPVSDGETLDELWSVLARAPRDLSDQYQERQDVIRGQIRTGDLLEIARALRDLLGRQGEHKLTQADRGLVDQAEGFIASELALALDISIDEAKNKVRSLLTNE